MFRGSTLTEVVKNSLNCIHDNTCSQVTRNVRCSLDEHQIKVLLNHLKIQVRFVKWSVLLCGLVLRTVQIVEKRYWRTLQEEEATTLCLNQ